MGSWEVKRDGGRGQCANAGEQRLVVLRTPEVLVVTGVLVLPAQGGVSHAVSVRSGARKRSNSHRALRAGLARRAGDPAH